MPRTNLLFRDLTAPKPSAAGKARHGKVWTLNLNERQLSLIDDLGATVLVAPAEAAESAIRIPFRRLDPEKIVNLGIADGQGDYYWFKPERATIKQIKQYVNLNILLQGPVAYAEMKGDAWGSFIAGCLALPTSIAVAVGVAWLFLCLTQWLPGGAVAVIGVGIVGVGASLFSVGIRDLLRFRELSRLRAQLDQHAPR